MKKFTCKEIMNGEGGCDEVFEGETAMDIPSKEEQKKWWDWFNGEWGQES